MTMNENDKQAEPVAFLVTWTDKDGNEWVHAHASEGTAFDQSQQKNGILQPLYTTPPATVQQDIPIGAIVNGRVYADRLQNEYRFDCEAGPLSMCNDWIEFLRCFEAVAQYIESHSAEAQQHATVQPAVAVNGQLLEVLRLIRGKHGCGALTLPQADLERVDAAIAAAEKAKGGA